MAGNSSEGAGITQDHGSNVEIALLALSAISVFATSVFLVTRLCCNYVIPVAWRVSLILQDVANLLLGAGLVFFLAYMGTSEKAFCSASGFFLLAGLLDAACMLGLATISVLFLQNPGKLGQLSTFRRFWIAVLVVPEKVLVLLLSVLPVTPLDYFDTDSAYPVACFPVRQEGGKGAAFGAILFFILWVLEITGLILSGISAFRLWKSNNSRIHASSPNLWQTEKIGQGRALQKMLILEQLFLLVLTLTFTVILYTNSADNRTPQWVVMVTVAVAILLHASLCGVQLVLWSSACCCQGNQKVKEPYQKLKKLELIKVEGPGKIRLRASWSAGKGVTRRGLVKVYGLNQLKGWAQEIVVLGMLRKSQHASLLQCLWTANTNPYFETMTMLSGQIVTSESRLICVELTSSGNLQDFLSSLDVPLPEPCTRTILHDLAEGLASLHRHNILHGNLTSAAVYLKGSVQRLVLRAALGDFEEAQVYGSLQNGVMTSSVSKKHFLLPDIRAFALVALEILGHVCKRRQEEKQPHRLIHVARTKAPPSADAGKDPKQQSSAGGAKNRAPSAPKARKNSPSANTHFCAPGAADQFSDDKDSLVGGRIFVVGSTPGGRDDQAKRAGKAGNKKRGGDNMHADGGLGHGGVIPPPSGFEDDGYMELGDFNEYDLEDDDSGLTSLEDNYPDSRGDPGPDGEGGDPRLPSITHVREVYSYEFPNQSVFKPRPEDAAENEYEELEDIEEEIHREIRHNALHRRREAARAGGYIVTRTTSGRELYVPANQHNTSFGNSDSGYVGTSSNSSGYPGSGKGTVAIGGGVGGADDLPADVVWPKAAHRTISANTISSFGDDILEVLPGMTDEDDLKTGDSSRRQLLRAREDARVEQILHDYELRVRQDGFSCPEKDWPKLKFSRTMAGPGGEAPSGGRSRPATPHRAASAATHESDNLSPRPQTAVPTPAVERGPTPRRVDRTRPLSASAPGAGAWKLRSSFKKSKARNELARALSRGPSFVQGGKPGKAGQRGAGGKLVERKYAAHNAAFKHDEDVEPGRTVSNGRGVDGRDYGGQERSGAHGGPSTATVERDVVNSGAPSYQNHQALQQQQQRNPIPVDQQEQGYQHHQGGVQVGKFSSFSSNDSSMASYGQPQHARDTSLTSGELTSLSSQADTAKGTKVARPQRETRDPQQSKEERTGADDGKDVISNKRVIVIPGMKIVDSGFDEDSVSVVSGGSGDGREGEAGEGGMEEEEEACTCSCMSDTLTGSGSCSCDCSQCRYSHSPRHSGGGWSESQSDSCGTWSNSNSFSSYDVKMHRRKLPSKPNSSSTAAPEEHVLGPDEQYPVHLPANVASAAAVAASNAAPPSSTPNQPTGSPNRLSPPGRSSHRQNRHHHGHNHHHHNHHQHGSCPHSNTASSTSSKESSSAASRRYRELTKKGVPLRVSVVDDSGQTGNPQQQHSSSHHHHHHHHHSAHGRSSFPMRDNARGTSDVIHEEEDGPDNALYHDLESQGFFESAESSSSSKSSPTRNRKRSSVSRRLEVVQGRYGNSKDSSFTHYSGLPPIPSLEDIIQEIPDETSGSCSGDETKAFLNRPESELSVKALKPPPQSQQPLLVSSSSKTSKSSDRLFHVEGGKEDMIADDGGDDTVIPMGHLHQEPKVLHDAELVIDRMFSKAHPANTRGSEMFVDPALGLDEAAIRELAMLPALTDDTTVAAALSPAGDLDGLGELQGSLPRGTDSKHVRYVKSLSSKVELLSSRELVPADARSFGVLKRRLQHVGTFGTIGQQLLDIVGACWVKENPPTTADLVEQLTDHVTETEL